MVLGAVWTTVPYMIFVVLAPYTVSHTVLYQSTVLVHTADD